MTRARKTIVQLNDLYKKINEQYLLFLEGMHLCNHVAIVDDNSKRFLTRRMVGGQTDIVLKYCKELFNNDKCTPMYEHMLWKIIDFEYSGCENSLIVILEKNHYAGD